MKFKLTIIILIGIILLAPKDGHGQERATEKGIALVLGGGGAKGFAHVGALKVIDSLGIKVDYIGGTSIGAIVGGLYAAGYSGLQIEEIARSSDWERLMADAVDRTLIPVNEKDFRERYLLSLPVREVAIKAPEGLIQGHNIINHLVALTSQVHQTDDFRKLPTPFFCIITDIEKGKEIVAESGLLPFALRASSSIPMYFAPFPIDGTLYVDGGVTNNFPVDKMRERYSGTIVGVDLQTGLHSGDDLESFTTLLNQLTTLIDYDNYQKNKELCDVYVRPDITGYSILDFSDAVVDSLIIRGEKAMIEQIGQLDHIVRTKSVNRTDGALIRRSAESVPYQYLILADGSRQDPNYIASMIGLSDEEKTDVGRIRHGMNRLYATGQFDYATYTLDPATATVTVYLKEREEFTINIGVNYEEGNSASVLLNVSTGGVIFRRDRLITDIVLAEGPRASVNYFIDRGLRPSPALSFTYTNLRMNYYDEGVKRGYSHTNALSFSAGLQSSFREKWTWGFSVNAEHFDYYNVLHALDYSPLEPLPFSATYYTWKLFFGYDSRNSAILHHSGSSLYLGARLPTDNLTTLGSLLPPLTVTFKHKVAIGNERRTLLPTLQAALSFGATPLPFFYKSFIGGLYKPYLTEMHIPHEGMGFAGIITDNALKAGLEFRSKIRGNHYGSLLVNWIAYGDTFTDLDAINNSFGAGARYLAITPLGPVQLTVMFSSPNNRARGHIHLGYFF